MLLDRLFNNLALTVEAFATCRVADGWRLRLPDLDWVTLHFVVQGTGLLRDGDGTVQLLPPDSLAIVPPHVQHSIECGRGRLAEATPTGKAKEGEVPEHLAGDAADARLVVLCGRIQARYGPGLGLFDRLHDIIVLDFSDEPLMRPTFEALLREQGDEGAGREFMMSSLMTQCLIHVFRKLCSSPNCTIPWLLALEDERMARVLDVILAHPEQPHSLESLSQTAYMSRSAFARRFRECFGRTPKEYVRDVRLRRAALLLSKDSRQSVEAVAKQVGFASRSQFSRAFHDFFGQAPADFRKNSAPAS